MPYGYSIMPPDQSPSELQPPITPIRRGRAWRVAIQLSAVATVFVVAAQYQWFLDEYALMTYHVAPEVAALVTPLGLTRYGQAILDRSKPQIDDKTAFNRDCQTVHGDLELGCYAGGRIYVLRIDNASLKPEMATVMAHELLHAAWARLPHREQTTLGNELEPIYHRLNDDDLNARMAGYATSEPGEETNELHSILGTEQPDLGNALLEAHYRQYFANRSAIVAAHAAYEDVFDTQRAQLASQLATIKTLKAQLVALDARMEADKTSGQIAAYNALVPSQNRLVDQVNGLIDTYDAGVDEYNALSASIDSHELTTEPGV